MDFLTASVLSGLLYEKIKDGAIIGTSLCKSILQGWVVNDEVIEELVEKLKEAGVNDDLGQHSIERRINESPFLLELLSKIPMESNSTSIIQTSNIGSNVVSSGSGSVTVGSIYTTKSQEE